MAADAPSLSDISLFECLELLSTVNNSQIYETKNRLKRLNLKSLIPYIRMGTLGRMLNEEINSRLELPQPPDYPDNWSMDVHMDFIESLEAGYPITLKVALLLSDTNLGSIHSGRRLIYDLERALSLPATGNKDKMFYNYSLRYYTDRTKDNFYPHRQLELAARSGKIEIIEELLPQVSQASRNHDFLRGTVMSGDVTLIDSYIKWYIFPRDERSLCEMIQWVFVSRNADAILHVLAKVLDKIEKRAIDNAKREQID